MMPGFPGSGFHGAEQVRNASEALRRVRELLEAGAFPAWSYRTWDPSNSERSMAPSVWPLVDVDGETLGAAVRCDSHGPEPTDAVAVSLLQIVSLLVASERRWARSIARAARAEQESLVDILTGLPNRRAWELALHRDAARRARTPATAVIAVIDLDDLKVVNDTRGHVAGDELLRTAADTLRAAVREGDAVARVGGDEFAVLATDWELGDPTELRDRLVDALRRTGVVASVGVAFHHPGQPPEEAYEAADRAMYLAKHHLRR